MFIEKLTKNELNEYFEKNIFSGFAKVEEINKKFLKQNKLKVEKQYTEIPEVFKDIQTDESNKIFCGYRLKDIKTKDGDLYLSYDIVKFTYASWIGAYTLDEISTVIILNDFSIDCLPFRFDLDAVNKNANWCKYLHSKFGEEYLTVYKAHLEELKNQELNKLILEIDFKNKKRIDELMR